MSKRNRIGLVVILTLIILWMAALTVGQYNIAVREIENRQMIRFMADIISHKLGGPPPEDSMDIGNMKRSSDGRVVVCP
jgi:hypothetical protein